MTTTQQSTYTIKIPPRFWEDHIDRGCTPALLEQRKGKTVIVTLDEEGISDLYTDAVYYSDPGDLDPDLFGLCMSARATAKAIRKQAPDWHAAYRASKFGSFDM